MLLAACGRLDFAARPDAMVDVMIDDASPDALSVTCPASYVSLDATSRRYKLDTSLLNWAETSASCAADGMHLFVPDDAAELATVMAHAAGVSTGSSVPAGSAWIGITDLATEGTYLTEAGLVAPYLPWYPGQPDNFGGTEHCVHFEPNDAINDLDCGFMLPSVCECP